ncbi:UNVERIFIED_CONTAM: hypothetical protein FKN15_061111 [Acipenser sinensis]
MKRQKRDWVIPPISISENGRGPFPKFVVQIKSNRAKEITLYYIITGPGADAPPEGLFTITKTGGELYVTQPVDRESQAQYILMSHVVDINGKTIEDPMEIIIKVTDQNDNRPEFTMNTFLGSISEGSAVGAVVMKVTATDKDDPTMDNGVIGYSILNQEPQEPHSPMFSINKSGTISLVAAGLDREAVAEYKLIIQAADMDGNGLSTTATAIITVTDQNDQAPQFKTAQETVSVPENEVGVLVTKLAVTDLDVPHTPAWNAKYTIVRGNTGNVFNITTEPSSNDGILRTAKGLDYETTRQHTLFVTVENEEPFTSTLPTATATITVKVEDVNEAPIFNPLVKSVVVEENMPIGSTVAVYTATDPDKEMKQTVTYRMGNDPAGWLEINNNGLIKVKQPMDRESIFVKDDTYTAMFLALDHASPPATGTGTLVVELTDVNDSSPEIVEREVRFCNKETVPQILNVVDRDTLVYAGPFKHEVYPEAQRSNELNVVTFPSSSAAGLKRQKRDWVIPPVSISENERGPFPKFVVQHEVYPEAQRSNELNVVTFPSSSAAGLKRQKRDWVIPPVSISENERGPFPKFVVQIKSNRAKEITVYYSITGPGADAPPEGLFTISRTGGELYVTQPLDRESQAQYILMSHAVDINGKTIEDPMEIKIRVTDQNDNRPKFTMNTFLGRISRTGGELYVTQSLDRESQAQYILMSHVVDINGKTIEDPMEIIIRVTDQNDNRPKFTMNTFLGRISEGSAVGSVVMKVTATDKDDPTIDNGVIGYSILNQEPQEPHSPMFSINKSGTISLVAAGLDREKVAEYKLIIQAADMDGNGLSTTATAIITVTDKNGHTLAGLLVRAVDTTKGIPVSNLTITVFKLEDSGKELKRRETSTGLTSAKGHFEMSNSLPSPGEYVVRLESGAYWKQQEKDFFHLYVEAGLLVRAVDTTKGIPVSNLTITVFKLEDSGKELKRRETSTGYEWSILG